VGKHSKLKFVRELRRVTDDFMIRQSLPKWRPHLVSGVSIIACIGFVLSLNHSKGIAFMFLLLNLGLDWLDGLVARKYHLVSEEGYMVDVAADRLSEGILFVMFMMPWFYLFALNNIMTILSFKEKKHIILPLRQAFLIYFFFRFIV